MIIRNKFYKLSACILLLLALLFTYSGYSVSADNSLEIDYDYRLYLRPYAYTGQDAANAYPVVELGDSTRIANRSITQSNILEGWYNFNLPYMGQPSQWVFVDFEFGRFSERMNQCSNLVFSGDFKVQGASIGYVVVYKSGDLLTPVSSRVINVVSDNWFSVDEQIDHATLQGAGYHIAFACRPNAGDTLRIDWINLNMQGSEEEEDTGFSILRFVKNIWNGIKNLPSNIASAFSSMINNVINTITNAVTFVTDFISSLVLPPEGFFNTTTSRFSQLLLNNTGFVGQVVSAIQGLYDVLRNAHADGTIATIDFKAGEYTFFPSATLNISENGFYQYIMNLPFVQVAFDGSLLFFAVLWAYKVISHCIFGILNYNEHLKADEDVNDVIGLGG